MHSKLPTLTQNDFPLGLSKGYDNPLSDRVYVNHLPQQGNHVTLFFQKILMESYRDKVVVADRFKEVLEQEFDKSKFNGGYAFQPNGGVLSIELSESDFAATRQRPVIVNADRISLSLTQIYHHTPYASAQLDPEKPSIFKRNGEWVEAEFNLLARHLEGNKQEHRQLRFSCKLEPIAIDEIQICLRDLYKSNDIKCDLFRKPNGLFFEKKLCISYPDMCLPGIRTKWEQPPFKGQHK